MSILDTIIGKIAPHDCLDCGTEGYLLCEACVDRLETIPERCYRCRRLSAGSLTCGFCVQTSSLYSVRVGAVYSGNAKKLIWQLKLAGAQAAAKIMAERMTPLIRRYAHDKEPLIIVPVPTATSRVRQRGYDQAKLLARELASQTRLPYLACLARDGQAHQHGASRRDRLTQLATALRVSSPRIVRNTSIILVDDVVTTGATLESAATVLGATGANRIEAVVFAQA